MKVKIKINTVAMKMNTRDNEGELFAAQWSTSV